MLESDHEPAENMCGRLTIQAAFTLLHGMIGSAKVKAWVTEAFS
jgi:hypothetical protein